MRIAPLHVIKIFLTLVNDDPQKYFRTKKIIFNENKIYFIKNKKNIKIFYIYLLFYKKKIYIF